jgi:hypothetical protein
LGILSYKREEIAVIDRSGFVIVEEIIKRNERVPLLDGIGLAELILTAGWYIWWERK